MFRQTAKKIAGSLYTWGRNTNSLGYAVPTQTTQQMTPQKVVGFHNNVSQVCLGPNHSALITTDGELYTWGSGGSGVLGHNNDKSYVLPKQIEFFAKNNLKVKQVSIGEHHTVALTEDGDVWTWGYGGREQNFLMDLLFLQVGALGHGDNKTRYTPTPVEELRKFPPIQYLSSGHRFVVAINDKKEIFNWGKGDYGVFGDGNNKSLKRPLKNEYVEYLKTQNLTIQDFKSNNSYTVALMSDGHLYGWGSNENGQMGIKTEIGVEIYETAQFPTRMVDEDFGGRQIVQYDVAEDITAVLLDNNEVWWSGSKLAYKPEKLKLPDGIGRIELLGTCFRSVVVVTEDDKIYFKNRFMQETEENIKTGIQSVSKQAVFGDGKILQIGGGYRNRFAIVQE